MAQLLISNNSPKLGMNFAYKALDLASVELSHRMNLEFQDTVKLHKNTSRVRKVAS